MWGFGYVACGRQLMVDSHIWVRREIGSLMFTFMPLSEIVRQWFSSVHSVLSDDTFLLGEAGFLDAVDFGGLL
jgi:hypothetical protein